MILSTNKKSRRQRLSIHPSQGVELMTIEHGDN